MKKNCSAENKNEGDSFLVSAWHHLPIEQKDPKLFLSAVCCKRNDKRNIRLPLFVSRCLKIVSLVLIEFYLFTQYAVKKTGDSVLVRFSFSKLRGKHFNLSATTAPTGAKN